jgi:MFS family permease
VHADIPHNSSHSPDSGSGPWYRELNRYHWFVFVVAALGWLFDTMDQQLFTLARPLAMEELITLTDEEIAAARAASVKPDESADAADKRVTEKLTAKRAQYGGYATSFFLIGWATGGLFFGVLGDRWGAFARCWSPLSCIPYLPVSAHSPEISGISPSCDCSPDSASVANLPSEWRLSPKLCPPAPPHALGLLQALSAVGNITAALIGMAGTGWKVMFLIGTAPALLSLLVRSRLREPERWQAVSATDGVAKQLGSYGELFGNPLLRYRALVGLLLACAGVIGLWGIGFFAPDLQRRVFGPMLEAQGMTPDQIKAQLKFLSGITLLMTNVGAFFGIFLYSYVSQILGRRATFAICFLGAMLATANLYWNLGKFAGTADIYWMAPLMGFFQLSIFGGYAVYFPELFPTRLRSTGTSFCYNVGRFVAAIGPYFLANLTSKVFSPERGYVGAEGFRWAGITMCSVFLIGLIALPFAPETKDQPLPE